MAYSMDNRETFTKILSDHGITQAESAGIICKATQRPLSVRTVRSWLNDPDKPSSRPCPDWAVKALQDAVALTQNNSEDQGALTSKCLRYASERSKFCQTRHTMQNQVDVWREFIFFLSGAGENVQVRVSEDHGRPSFKTDFTGLRELIGRNTPIEVLEYT